MVEKLLDSFGQELQEDDPVLLYTYYRRETNGKKFYVCSYYLRRVKNGELVSFKGNKLERFNVYHTLRLRLTTKDCLDLFNQEEERMSYKTNINFLNDYMLNQENEYKNTVEHHTLRGMPVKDIFGRELKVGDFVYFFEDDKACYGIMMSETQVFSNYLEIKTVHHVILMAHLTDEEVKLKNKLLKQSMNLAKVIKNMEPKRGDIFKSKGKTYVYVGNIKLFTSGKLYKEYKSSWLLLRGISLGDIEGIESGVLRVEEPLIDSFEHYISMYGQEITSMKNILDKIPRTSYLVGHIQIDSVKRLIVYADNGDCKCRLKLGIDYL